MKRYKQFYTCLNKVFANQTFPIVAIYRNKIARVNFFIKMIL